MLLLVVDDDALSRELLTLVLELEGYSVEAVASGEEALSRLAGCDPADLAKLGVILADLQMPGVAGHALAQALRPLVPAQTLLFAMSGSEPDPGSISQFDGFLLKPFKISELQSMISGGKALAVGRTEPVTESQARNETSNQALNETLNETLNDGVLDDDIYSKLSEIMPVEQLGQMYGMCLDDSRRRIARMKALAAEGEDAGFRSEAHAVKGGCGMIGAKELYGLAEAAERQGLAGGSAAGATNSELTAAGTRTNGVTATLDRLSLACDRLERILVARTRA